MLFYKNLKRSTEQLGAPRTWQVVSIGSGCETRGITQHEVNNKYFSNRKLILNTMINVKFITKLASQLVDFDIAYAGGWSMDTEQAFYIFDVIIIC